MFFVRDGTHSAAVGGTPALAGKTPKTQNKTAVRSTKLTTKQLCANQNCETKAPEPLEEPSSLVLLLGQMRKPVT